MSGIPTGVSGATTFFPDVLDLIQEASERAGVDNTSGGQLRTARFSLDLLSQEWANEGLNLWTVDSQTLALLPSTATYPLPQDTIDIIYPLIRYLPDGITPTDLPMSRVDFAGYAAIPNKAYQGRPTMVYVDRLAAAPSVTVWPVPPTTPAYTLVYYRMRRINDTGSATNNMDIPMRFVPAMIAGLAFKLAQKSRDPLTIQKLPYLKQEYMEAFDKACYEDRDRSSIRLVPLAVR